MTRGADAMSREPQTPEEHQKSSLPAEETSQ